MKRTPIRSAALPTLYRSLAISAAAALMLSTPTAQAVDVVWSGGNGSWADGAKWSSALVPDSNSAVRIDNGNPLSSVVDLTGSASVKSLTITAGDGLRVLGSASFAALSGSISNAGTLTLAGNSNGSAGLSLAANTALAGSGSTVLRSDRFNGSFVDGNGYTLTVGSGHTLRGAGALNFGDGAIVNRGIVLAEGDAIFTMLMINPRTFDNNDGLVQVADGGRLGVYGKLTGGRIQSLGQGTIEGGTYQNVALSGSFNVWSEFEIAGTLTNTGTLTLAGSNSAGYATLNLSANTTLAGSGSTVLSTSSRGFSGLIFGNGHSLTVGSGHTLRGAGVLGIGDIAIVNQGTVLAEGSTPLYIQVNSGGFNNSSGTLKIAGEGSVVMDGDLLLDDGSALVFDISGTALGSSHGSYSDSGLLNLDGLLELRFTGYTARVGDSFTLLTSSSFSGQFDRVVAAGYTLQTFYNLGDVTVTVTGVTAVPEPATHALWLAGLAAVGLGRCLRRRG